MTSFRDAWLAGEPRANALLPNPMADADARRAHVERVSREGLRPAMREELRRQHAPWRDLPGVDASLARLDEPGVCFVVTGQQVGLFGGPLLALHKACAAIRLARRLEHETGIPVVPLFWLQSEDHDLREIARATVLDRDGHVIVLEAPVDVDARHSVAHETRIANVEALRGSVRDALEGLPFGAEAIALLERSYADDHGWVDAFARWTLGLLGREGLLLFSPRTEPVATLAAPVHRWAIASLDAIGDALTRTAVSLDAAGYATQVPTRPDCSLSFVHPRGAAGPRYRIRRAGDVLEAAGGNVAWSETELLAKVDATPLHFSTSALLRPLLQESLLPSVATVGGPAEVAYFAQVTAVARVRGQRPPVVVARPSLRWRSERCDASLRALNLDPGDLAASDADLAQRLMAAEASGDLDLEARMRAAVEGVLAEVEPELLALDAALATGLRKTRSSVARSAARLARRVRHARFGQNRARVDALREARGMYWPAGVAQERSLGALSIVARIGVDSLVTRTLHHASPALGPSDHASAPEAFGVRDVPLHEVDE